MIEPNLWLKRVQQAWTQRSVVWLSGVRRVGKTTIARMLPQVGDSSLHGSGLRGWTRLGPDSNFRVDVLAGAALATVSSYNFYPAVSWLRGCATG